ncbi:MAG: hypothetical protein FWH14_06335 [Oscillospiraceae bacterium]|nr:hypothetical protein [Oscillospiraceae bacterium]
MRQMRTRKIIRLKGHDYSDSGVYFITICVKDGHEMLGSIVGMTAPGHPLINRSSMENPDRPHETRTTPENGRPGAVVPTTKPRIELTPLGVCVDETIQKANRNNVSIPKYVIMPNHIHMIVILSQKTADDKRETDDRGRSSLPQVVRNIKSFVTKEIGFSIWQPRFHDHIIRTRQEYRRIWHYIDKNPEKWSEDEYYKYQP